MMDLTTTLKELFEEEESTIITIELNDYFNLFVEGLTENGETLTNTPFNVENIKAILIELINAENGEFIKTIDNLNININTTEYQLKTRVKEDLTSEYAEEITELLEDMSDNELITTWNEYQNENYYENQVYYMEEFNEIMNGYEPLQLASLVWNGEFNPNDDYFTFGVYLESHYSVSDLISINELADFIIDNGNDLDNYEITEIIEKYNF